MKRTIGLLIVLLTLAMGVQAQQEQQLPIIIQFKADRDSVPLDALETGTETVNLSWQTLNMGENYRLELYVYEIATWVLQVDAEGQPLVLEATDDIELPMRHPLNFNPPTYRLIVTDNNLQVYSEAVVTIPYLTRPTLTQPSIARFTAEPASITADTLGYGAPSITVAWEVADRSPTSNLVFEQLLPDDTTVSVELSRRNLWVNSTGSGVIAAVYPSDGKVVVLKLKLVDLVSGDVLDEAGQQITITGVLSTPTPGPTRAPTNTPGGQQQVVAENPVPVTSAGAGGGFELGGHVATFSNMATVQRAGMTWIKQQVRWHRGDGTGAASGIIGGAHGSGVKVLLGIVGYRDEMGDFEAYTDEFAAYLGQVAALGPDAIEVWNEPNIDREWPAGTISGANYTRMLSKAFNAIKAANSNVIVISGALAPTGFFGGGCANGGCDDNAFLRQMSSAGAVSYMDCVGAHYNEGIISPDQNSGDPRGGHYSRYFTAMLNLYYNTFGGARPVCWTELGYLTPEGYTPLPSNFAWAQNTTLAQHAEWLGRAASLSRESGRVRLMIVWNVDFQIYDSDPQAGFAILRGDGNCPACDTLSAAMR
jgi:hypothetical protein